MWQSPRHTFDVLGDCMVYIATILPCRTRLCRTRALVGRHHTAPAMLRSHSCVWNMSAVQLWSKETFKCKQALWGYIKGTNLKLILQKISISCFHLNNISEVQILYNTTTAASTVQMSSQQMPSPELDWNSTSCRKHTKHVLATMRLITPHQMQSNPNFSKCRQITVECSDSSPQWCLVSDLETSRRQFFFSTQATIRTSTHSRQFTDLSLIHIWRCRRSTLCRSRWSPYH